jgi:energy-coupling factor transporter ATP-binding protein EcfA2
MKSQDIAVVGILLAVGAIVRYLSLVIPGPIVSNLVIAFYCLAIILVAPTFKEALGIGVVAGIVCAMISHSIFPPANLISEPLGAMVCLLVYRTTKKYVPIAPAISTFLGTLASGCTFVGVAIMIIAPTIISQFTTMGAFVLTIIPIVFMTAVANAIIVQILFFPASRMHVRSERRHPEEKPGSGSYELPEIPPITREGDHIAYHLTDYSYTYPGAQHPALSHISVRIKRGGITFITGPTAAGKTTFCHALAGILHHETSGRSEGRVMILGKNVTDYQGVGEISQNIGIMFDDADAQLIFTSVEEEIVSGLENKNLTLEEVEERLEYVMRRTGISELRKRAPHTLSGGQKQRVALAAALALDTEVLILDEPTSELDGEVTANVVKILGDLKAKGKTIVVVDHKTEDFTTIADQVIVLEKGEISAMGGPRVLRLETLPETSPVLLAEPEPRVPIHKGQSDLSAPIISIRRLTQQFDEVRALDGIDLDIYPGEFLAIMGDNGSGKTTLVKHFNGLLKPSEGIVLVKGRETAAAPITDLVKYTGLVFQNPDSMLFEDSVEKEVAFGVSNIREGQNKDIINQVLSTVGLEEKKSVYPRHLSRGERQRLAVASILAMEPEVIVLDEPTTGLDHEETMRIMGLMQRLQTEGHTIVMVTHNMHIVEHFAHRVVRMEQGKITGDVRYRGGQCS